MKRFILICTLLFICNTASYSQVSKKAHQLDILQLQIGTGLASTTRVGFNIGLTAKSDRHWILLQYNYNNDLMDIFLSGNGARKPQPAKILATNNFSLGYGYDLFRRKEMALFPVIGLVGGQELYRSFHYERIERPFWDSYENYRQRNYFMGLTASLNFHYNFCAFGIPVRQFFQPLALYYGRFDFMFSSGFVVPIYRKKADKN